MPTITSLTENVKRGSHAENIGGRVDYFVQVCRYVDHVAISTASATWTKPAGARYVIFSSTGPNFAIRANAAAVFPAGGLTDGSGSALNPSQRDVSDIDTLGIIADGSGILTIECYGE